MRHSALRHTRADAEQPVRPVLACTRRGSPFHRILPFDASAGCSHTVTQCFLALLRLNRIITQGRPCRFCAIAVAPATRTCIRLRTRPVGGLSSAAFRPPSAALSLSRVVWMVKGDKGSGRDATQDSRCGTKATEPQTQGHRRRRPQTNEIGRSTTETRDQRGRTTGCPK